MDSRDIQLPSTNLSTSIEVQQAPSSSTAQRDLARAPGLVNKQPSSKGIGSPGSAIKSVQKHSYTSKRVFKIIVIGDANVGKTCISYRFCTGKFPSQTESTIGVDFRERTVIIENQMIRIQLWDTAGQERYRQSIVSHYYRNVNAVVFVYDVNNPASFNSLPVWLNECRKHNVSSENIPHILIGNKCDLDSTTNRVRTDLAQIFSDKHDMAFFETSALKDSEIDHIDSIFMTLILKLQQNKSMHVQSTEEREEKAQTLLLKAGDAKSLEESEGWCC